MTRQRISVGSIRGLAVLVSLALGLSACGGGGSSPTGSSGPTRQSLGTRTWAAAPGDGLIVDVTIGQTGTLDATAQWTNATNDVDVFLTSSSCSAQAFVANLCNILAKADSATNKPERMTASVISGNYKVWVYNLGPGTESGTVDMGLTY